MDIDSDTKIKVEGEVKSEVLAAPTDIDLSDEPTKEKITTKFMTKYELSRVLGTRALQIRYDRSHLLSAGTIQFFATQMKTLKFLIFATS